MLESMYKSSLRCKRKCLRTFVCKKYAGLNMSKYVCKHVCVCLCLYKVATLHYSHQSIFIHVLLKIFKCLFNLWEVPSDKAWPKRPSGCPRTSVLTFLTSCAQSINSGFLEKKSSALIMPCMGSGSKRLKLFCHFQKGRAGNGTLHQTCLVWELGESDLLTFLVV